MAARRAGIWLRRFHRWLGLAAAAFVLLLAVTGLLLNHADALSLDHRRIRTDWIVRLYGLEPPALIDAREAGSHWISLWGDRLFVDDTPIDGISASTLVAAFGDDGRSNDVVLTVITDRQLLLLAPSGGLVDALAAPTPRPLVTAARRLDPAPPGNDAPRSDALRSDAPRSDAPRSDVSGDDAPDDNAPGPRTEVHSDDGQRWSTDIDATGWRAEPPSPAGAPSITMPAGAAAQEARAGSGLPEALRDRIRQWWHGEGISALQFVRDLHSGVAGRSTGRRLIDLAALALLFLALSGAWMALRRGRG